MVKPAHRAGPSRGVDTGQLISATVVEARGVRQDRVLEPLQTRRGLDPVVLDQVAPEPATGRQRFGGPSTSVEGHHQAGMQVFPRRAAVEQGADLTDEGLVISEFELELDTLLEGEGAALVQPAADGFESGNSTQVFEGPSAP
ncbi:hypothetical protein PV721_22475 [Streptomyces sp. MB09-01]|nr:hypothetical protein [Streptomyces sp. MB09-01]MDX3537090.1 hypothetical protein [Streptomyces sp. MB09-01]